MKATLKEKLGVDFRRYQILGACNPKLAHEALTYEVGLGVMLPCNVAVWEDDAGKVTVAAVDPLQTIASQDPKLEPIATQVRERLSASSRSSADRDGRVGLPGVPGVRGRMDLPAAGRPAPRRRAT